MGMGPPSSSWREGAASVRRGWLSGPGKKHVRASEVGRAGREGFRRMEWLERKEWGAVPAGESRSRGADSCALEFLLWHLGIGPLCVGAPVGVHPGGLLVCGQAEGEEREAPQ